MQNAKLEEYNQRHQHTNQNRQHGTHCDVLLGALNFGVSLAFATQLFNGYTQRVFDNACRADDTDDTCHCDTADTQRTTISEEDLLGAHSSRSRALNRANQRNNHKPHQQRTCANQSRIFQTHDIAQTQHSCACIDTAHGFELVGQSHAPTCDAGRNSLRPQTEGTDDEVIQTTNQTTHGQQFGLRATLFARHQHLGGCCTLGEGVFAVHILNKVFAEGDNQQDSEHTAKQRAEEHLVELRLQAQDVERGQCEDCTRNNHTRRSADTLDDYVLTQHILLAGHCADTHSQNCDGDSSLEHLTHLQTEVSRSSREDDCHNDTHRNRVGSHLLGFRLRFEQRFVLLTRSKFAVGVFGQ